MTANEPHNLVPGDVLLVRERSNETGEFVLFPVPTDDPNDPLNWSNWRKAFNYFLIMAQTVAVFTALSTQTTFWPQMTVDLGIPIPVLNNAQSAMSAGLSVGCIFFIPFTKKYGRRSTYVLSTAVMAATSWWIYRMETKAELFVINLFYGLAGATNETIVQVTISDLFFVHQRGTMNACYLTAVMVGSFLTPMIAGVQAQSQGWRRSYLALAISLTVVSILVLVGYEETKYIPVLRGVPDQYKIDTEATEADYISRNVDTTKNAIDPKAAELTVMPSHVNAEIPPNTYRQRLRWLTPSSESLAKITIFPIYVITFPHVLYAAVQYACGVASLVTMASMISIAFSAPPYNFGTAGLGYMNLGPFVGNIIGSFFTGYLSDVSLRWLAKRNKGYYEPEMRLYLLLLPSFCISGGLIMFGCTTARGMHWIYPSIGGAMFAFGLGAIGDVAFTMVIDTYRPLTAEAFVGISFIRNAISIPIPFAISPWMRGMGIQNMFVTLGLVVFAFALLFIPMIIWGKKLRAYYTPKYYKLLEKQGGIAADALAAGQTS